MYYKLLAPTWMLLAALVLLPAQASVANPANAQGMVSLSKNSDFSTEDHAYDRSDKLYIRVVATSLDFTSLEDNEIRLKPSSGGNDIETTFQNHLNGTYTARIDLSHTDASVANWELRLELEDHAGREFETRISIRIGEGNGNNDDEDLEFTGVIDEIGDDYLVVSSLKILVDAGTVVLNDDNVAIEFSDLVVGQIVEVHANHLVNGQFHATRIEIEDDFDNDDDEVEFTGRLEAISANEVTVSGLAFAVNANTIILDDRNLPISLEQLQIGQLVEVRGENLNGVLTATHIKLEDNIGDQDEVEFTGVIDALSASEITVGGVTFAVDANTVVLDQDNLAIEFSALVVGLTVEIKGLRQADGSLRAARIKIEDRQQDEIEITGVIEQLDANQIVVAGRIFIINAQTVVLNNDNEAITLDALSVGTIVEIKGRIQADGSVVAIRIKLEDRVEDEVEVRGLIDAVSADTVTVLGRDFVATATTEVFDNNNAPIGFDNLAAGQLVEVKANLQPNGMLVALRIKLEDGDPTRVEVEGPVDSVSVATLHIAGIVLALNGQTAVFDTESNSTTLDAIQAGQSVKAIAVTRENDTPLVTRVDIRRVAVVSGMISSAQVNVITVAGENFILTDKTFVVADFGQLSQSDQLTQEAFVEVYAAYVGDLGIATQVRLLQNGSIVTLIKDDDGRIPREFILNQNYPNPFNPTTRLSFDILASADASVSLVVYNALGQEVRTLVSGMLVPGRHEIVWDARNNAGELQASGLYFYRLEVNSSVETRAMTLLR